MNEIESDITAVSVVRHGVLHLTFADGLEGEVDVTDYIQGRVYRNARTVDGFREVRVDAETGTIVWPGEVDFAPDTLYLRVKTGEWPAGINVAL